MNSSQVVVTWEDFDILLFTLVDKIKKNNWKPEWITGVPRGGLIPAVCLSHRLKIPFVEFHQREKNTMVVDDIVDGGDTLRSISRAEYIVVLGHKGIVEIPQKVLVGCLWPKSSWVVFPWET